ncbi:uncharacterized protein L201_005935 [Kwoniella dendrophila CBS 6074]|uniref:Stc1 domain-containing protein n=1 Tax=Kwoniella dendrophila CBS 6074 TaxID=1295534 RepID=A0AAX4K0C6_9TREE
MQSSQGQGSNNNNNNNDGISQNRQGEYYTVRASLFPIDGARTAGVHSQPGVIQQQQQSANIAGSAFGNNNSNLGYPNGLSFPNQNDQWSWDTSTLNSNSHGQGNVYNGSSNNNNNQAESSSMANAMANTHTQNQLQHHRQSEQQSNLSSATNQKEQSDPISAFLSEMPTQREDPTRHVLWTELIKLKTRTLELQIAEARRKEKEAELELMRLKAGAATKSDNPNTNNMDGNINNGGQGSSGHLHSTNSNNSNNNGQYPMMAQTQPPSVILTHNQQDQNHITDMFTQQQNNNIPVMSPFDLEAMLSNENIDSFLSWLPDLGDHPLPDVLPLAPSTDYPNILSNPPQSLQQSTNVLSQSQSLNPSYPPIGVSVADPGNTVHQSQNASSPRRRSVSVEDQTSPKKPPSSNTTKKTRTTEKKIVIEQISLCLICKKNLGRIMIRSPKSSMPNPILIELKCIDCIPINQPDSSTSSNSTTNNIGTVETRKRIRIQMEIDDEELKLKDRRQWCDVCQRVVGSGQISGGSGSGSGSKENQNKESISSITEIVCTGCDGKYQRCTDCGGGGGPRVGIGKWRMKQVFHPGRKTCSLNHTRLGDRTRELGVHVTPTDFTPEQMKEVLTRCKALWNEKTLARLAVPEMLEVDLPSGLSNPLRDFGDVDDMVTRNWPSREAMIKADELDPNRFRRMLSLIWSHSKPRRSVRTVDLEEEWSRPEDGDDDLSTVLANVKKTNVVIPPGSELIGMWGGEWNMQNGSLLISTFIPFEGADGEDSTALSVGEMITKVQSLQQEINAERTSQAKKQGKQPDLLPPCEHLWTVSGGYIPLVRERFADILIRKRSFVHVEEYLTRHPEFIESIRARPVGLHPDIHRPTTTTITSSTDLQAHSGNEHDDEENKAKPLILVRWLGKEFDAAKILEIKQMEFGGGPKKKKRKL